MRSYRWITITISIFFFHSSQAQKLSLEFQSFPSLTPNYSPGVIVPHSGATIYLRHGAQNRLEGGLSFRSVPWGSEVSLSEAYIYKLMDKRNFFLENSGRLYLGIPLYYNKFSFSSSISNEVIFGFVNFQRLRFVGGLRLNLNPSYAVVSDRYFFGESVFGIRLALQK